MPAAEINGNCVFGNWDRPEQTAFGDPRIEIVNLHVLHGTCEYVKSYEREGAMVIASIGADELAAHKAHVGLEGKVLRGLTVTVCVPMPPTAAQPTKPLKLVIVEGSAPGAGRKNGTAVPTGQAVADRRESEPV